MWNLDDTAEYTKVYTFCIDRVFTWGRTKKNERTGKRVSIDVESREYIRENFRNI